MTKWYRPQHLHIHNILTFPSTSILDTGPPFFNSNTTILPRYKVVYSHVTCTCIITIFTAAPPPPPPPKILSSHSILYYCPVLEMYQILLPRPTPGIILEDCMVKTPTLHGHVANIKLASILVKKLSHGDIALQTNCMRQLYTYVHVQVK